MTDNPQLEKPSLPVDFENAVDAGITAVLSTKRNKRPQEDDCETMTDRKKLPRRMAEDELRTKIAKYREKSKINYGKALDQVRVARKWQMAHADLKRTCDALREELASDRDETPLVQQLRTKVVELERKLAEAESSNRHSLSCLKTSPTASTDQLETIDVLESQEATKERPSNQTNGHGTLMTRLADLAKNLKAAQETIDQTSRLSPKPDNVKDITIALLHTLRKKDAADAEESLSLLQCQLEHATADNAHLRETVSNLREETAKLKETAFRCKPVFKSGTVNTVIEATLQKGTVVERDKTETDDHMMETTSQNGDIVESETSEIERLRALCQLQAQEIHALGLKVEREKGIHISYVQSLIRTHQTQAVSWKECHENLNNIISDERAAADALRKSHDKEIKKMKAVVDSTHQRCKEEMNKLEHTNRTLTERITFLSSNMQDLLEENDNDAPQYDQVLDTSLPTHPQSLTVKQDFSATIKRTYNEEIKNVQKPAIRLLNRYQS